MYQDKHIVHSDNGIVSANCDHPSWRIHKWGGINLEVQCPYYPDRLTIVPKVVDPLVKVLITFPDETILCSCCNIPCKERAVQTVYVNNCIWAYKITTSDKEVKQGGKVSSRVFPILSERELKNGTWEKITVMSIPNPNEEDDLRPVQIEERKETRRHSKSAPPRRTQPQAKPGTASAGNNAPNIPAFGLSTYARGAIDPVLILPGQEDGGAQGQNGQRPTVARRDVGKIVITDPFLPQNALQPDAPKDATLSSTEATTATEDPTSASSGSLRGSHGNLSSTLHSHDNGANQRGSGSAASIGRGSTDVTTTVPFLQLGAVNQQRSDQPMLAMDRARPQSARDARDTRGGSAQRSFTPRVPFHREDRNAVVTPPAKEKALMNLNYAIHPTKGTPTKKRLKASGPMPTDPAPSPTEEQVIHFKLSARVGDLPTRKPSSKALTSSDISIKKSPTTQESNGSPRLTSSVDNVERTTSFRVAKALPLSPRSPDSPRRVEMGKK